MDELLLTLKAIRDKDSQQRKFLAAIQGIDLEENEKEDIADLKGVHAQDGFGIGMGLGYEVQGD